MKTKLHVHYLVDSYIGGFKFLDYVSENNDGRYLYLGEIEIDNPFEIPDLSVINNLKIEEINKEIQNHKAKINLLENKVKDLLCIESVEEAS